jgi:hypothetical protein
MASGDQLRPRLRVADGSSRILSQELAWVVELQSGDALSGRGDGRLRELAQLAAIDEGLQDVLLHVEVIIGDCRERIAQNGKILHRFRFAWNTLIDQPWKIMSVARRDWAVVGQSF